MQQQAAEIKIRAEWKAGALLAEISPGRGGDRRSESSCIVQLDSIGICVFEAPKRFGALGELDTYPNRSTWTRTGSSLRFCLFLLH